MKDDRGRDIPRIELRSLLEPGGAPKYEFEMDLCLKTTTRGRCVECAIHHDQPCAHCNAALQVEQVGDADLPIDKPLQRRSAWPFPKTSEAVLLFQVSRLSAYVIVA